MSPQLDAFLRPHAHDDDHYCARCLEPVGARDRACESCDLRFEGSGRFDRLPGRPPEASEWVQAIRGESREAA